MGIYIPGMEMPDISANNGINFCLFRSLGNKMRIRNYETGEVFDVIPVPKHEDLIDRGALCKAIITQGDMADLRVVDMTRHIAQMFALLVIDAPVVIPAEEGET